MPTVHIALTYPHLTEIADAPGFLKHMPSVYRDHPLFNFDERNFELRERDRAFLKEVPELASEQLELIIDCLEKIAFMYRDCSPPFMQSKFVDHCTDEALENSLTSATLSKVITQYWRPQRIE